MKIIGITGGTGSGKTTVLSYLKEKGAHVIDCDEVYHELLESDLELLAELEASFDGVVSDGRLDRKGLGTVVFTDPGALERLNTIAHKYVGREVDRQLAKVPEDGVAAIDAIALLESDIKSRCDVVVGVIAPAELRARRIAAREGIDADYAHMRINAQRPNEYFISNCDRIIDNSSDDLSELYDKCAALFDEIL